MHEDRRLAAIMYTDIVGYTALVGSDEYMAKGVYMLPEEATWEYLRENTEMDDIKVKVNQDTWN